MNKRPLKKIEIIELLKNIPRPNLGKENIDVFKSKDRILFDSIKSKINLPPFNNSAVDGFAIKDDDLTKSYLHKINERITAGANKKIFLKRGQVVRIFTGAKMPLNSSTVVMQENTQDLVSKIKINKKHFLGENCRLKGEDVNKGQIVFAKGQKIITKNISLLAAIGKSKVKVNKKLNVGFFTSGNELINPSKNLSGSKIINSNKYALHSLLDRNYLNSKYLGVLKDSEKQIIKLINKNLNKYSIIITTGGASVGEEDFLVKVLKDKGKLFFWKAAIKPGRTLAIGKIKNTIFICLPGNPVSVFLLYGMIIKPFLLYMCGSSLQEPLCYPAKVNFNMKKKTERLEWLRATIDRSCKNELQVSKYLKQGSGIISSVAFADGLIEIPENISQIKAGDKYNLYLFSELFD